MKEPIKKVNIQKDYDIALYVMMDDTKVYIGHSINLVHLELEKFNYYKDFDNEIIEKLYIHKNINRDRMFLKVLKIYKKSDEHNMFLHKDNLINYYKTKNTKREVLNTVKVNRKMVFKALSEKSKAIKQNIQDKPY